LISSGAAKQQADQLVDVVGRAGAYALPAAVLVFTVTLGRTF
jgi:di/tricarboxylate transporter